MRTRKTISAPNPATAGSNKIRSIVGALKSVTKLAWARPLLPAKSTASTVTAAILSSPTWPSAATKVVLQTQFCWGTTPLAVQLLAAKTRAPKLTRGYPGAIWASWVVNRTSTLVPTRARGGVKFWLATDKIKLEIAGAAESTTNSALVATVFLLPALSVKIT